MQERVVHSPSSEVAAPAYMPPEHLYPAQPLERGEVLVLADPDRVSAEAPDVVAAHDLWGITCQRLRQRMIPRSYDLFIDPLEPLSRDGPVLHLRAPSAVIADHVRLKHRRELEAELEAITGHAMQIAI